MKASNFEGLCVNRTQLFLSSGKPAERRCCAAGRLHGRSGRSEVLGFLAGERLSR